MVNSSYMMGGALGLAVVSSISAARAGNLLASAMTAW
jgi:hypothetical protein